MSKFTPFIFIFLAVIISCDQMEQPTIDAFSLIQAENFNLEIGKVENGNYDGISRFDRVITYSVIRSFDTGDVLVFENINFRNNLFVSRFNVFQGNTSQIIANNWYLNFDRPSEVLFDSTQAGNGDPRLVNLMGRDFNLTSESPLRGKATNLSEFYQVDFNGTTLPKSGAWDVGALQYK